MDQKRRQFLKGSLAATAVVLGGAAVAGGALRPAGIADHYRAWEAAVDAVAREDSRRVVVMNAVGGQAIGRHYGGSVHCPALAEADGRCDTARARRDRIEKMIARAPVADPAERQLQQRVVSDRLG